MPRADPNLAGAPLSVVVICHGNICRSQVLSQYLQHESQVPGCLLGVSSAGVAAWEAYPDTEQLLAEVEAELARRGIHCRLQRSAWSPEVEERVAAADWVLAADLSVRQVVAERMMDRLDTSKLRTYYGFIGEGERSFEDTYDHDRGRQDPVRFGAAFDELSRIACRMIPLLTAGSRGG